VNVIPAALEAARATSTAVLTIDLGRLRANYRTLREKASGSECAAVVKANAYGAGTEETVKALVKEGCKTFFVATFNEALGVRKAAPQATVYVLDGFFSGSGESFEKINLRPVLCSIDDIRDWAAFCENKSAWLPAAIQVDTGMNRLGLPRKEVEQLAADTSLLDGFDCALLISHLACADEPGNPMNARQLKAFQDCRAMLPPCPASFANSGGILLGETYHFDLVRAGFAIYGGRAIERQPSLEAVVQLHARISQIHEAAAGETVGYGAAQTLDRPTRIATISIGYADGIFRCLGSNDRGSGLSGYIADHQAPILGRVSMDLITLDVTNMPDDLARRGQWVEIIGPHVSVDDLADEAGTIGYEILTSLSRRAQRVYVDSEPVSD
jgi:alanine racemase